MTVQEKLIVAIVPDAREVPGELPGSDRVTLIGKRRDVALHRRIEVELPLLVQQRDGGGGERLGHAPDPKLRLGGDRGLAGEIRIAESFRPHELAVDADRHLEAGNATRQLVAHEGMRARDGRGVGWRDRRRGARHARRLATGAAAIDPRGENRCRNQTEAQGPLHEASDQESTHGTESISLRAACKDVPCVRGGTRDSALPLKPRCPSRPPPVHGQCRAAA